jgi:hypothetical protein
MEEGLTIAGRLERGDPWRQRFIGSERGGAMANESQVPAPPRFGDGCEGRFSTGNGMTQLLKQFREFLRMIHEYIGRGHLQSVGSETVGHSACP